ncbi:uncharacterized protein [Watersipora subatra]|uniref:uncharacterized protein n=1 Tax=Watersipora subatra TaxID=2589382 RepID=UPI00355C22A8
MRGRIYRSLFTISKRKTEKSASAKDSWKLIRSDWQRQPRIKKERRDELRRREKRDVQQKRERKDRWAAEEKEEKRAAEERAKCAAEERKERRAAEEREKRSAEEREERRAAEERKHELEMKKLELEAARIASGSSGKFHRGVQCDECKQRDIAGIRYKFSDCPDYDLCETCEAKPRWKRLYKMSDLKQLIELGKEMGYDGENLQKFVHDQQEKEREERQHERQLEIEQARLAVADKESRYVSFQMTEKEQEQQQSTTAMVVEAVAGVAAEALAGWLLSGCKINYCFLWSLIVPRVCNPT